MPALARKLAGTCAMRSSMLPAPIASSIERTSSSVCGMNLIVGKSSSSLGAPPVKWPRDHGRRNFSIPHLDRELRADCRKLGTVDVCHRDWPLERRREGSAGHRTRRSIIYKDRIALARDGACIVGSDADEILLQTIRALGSKRFFTNEAPAELQVGREPSFEWRGVAIEFVTVQREAGFEAQGIARAEPARFDVIAFTRKEDLSEETRPILRGDEKLEAILAGVTGARRETSHAAHFAIGDPEPLHFIDRKRRELLQDRDRSRTLHRDQSGLFAGVEKI